MNKGNELVIIDTEDMFARAQTMIDKKLIPSGIKNAEDVVVIVNKVLSWVWTR